MKRASTISITNAFFFLLKARLYNYNSFYPFPRWLKISSWRWYNFSFWHGKIQKRKHVFHKVVLQLLKFQVVLRRISPVSVGLLCFFNLLYVLPYSGGPRAIFLLVNILCYFRHYYRWCSSGHPFVCLSVNLHAFFKSRYQEMEFLGREFYAFLILTGPAKLSSRQFELNSPPTSNIWGKKIITAFFPPSALKFWSFWWVKSEYSF